MSSKTTILQVRNKSIEGLETLLNSKEFIDLSAKDKLDFFKQIDLSKSI